MYFKKGTALTKSKGDVLTHTEEKTGLDQIYAGLEKQFDNKFKFNLIFCFFNILLALLIH